MGAHRRAFTRLHAVTALVAVAATVLSVGVAVVGAAPPAAAADFDCSPGVVYTQERVSGGGGAAYVTKVTVATGATQRWAGSFAQSGTNGLAINGTATTSYAVDQSASGSTTNIYALSSSGTRTTVASGIAVSGVDAGNLVGGAIAPSNGFYYFGGYSVQTVGGTARAVFELHAYDIAAGSYVGRVLRVLIPQSTPDLATNATGNGDISFDAQGNLYLIWSFTGGATNKLVRVSASSIPSTAGSTLVTATLLSSPAASANGLAYNGMTFDGNGILYLQNASSGSSTTQIAAYDPNTGAPVGSAVTVNGMTGYGVDLASCSYPPTLQLKKDVVGRLPASDQFGLAIYRTDTATAPATATTTGADTGVQDEVAGPVIALPSTVYRIVESAAAGADLSKYLTTYACSWGSETTAFASGTAALSNGVKAATLPAIPSGRSGQQLTCTFMNAPLAASVTIRKQVQDAFGQSQAAASGWTVGASTAATAGTVTANPTASTQATDATGKAVWNLTYGTTASRATVTVSETQQADYRFVSGSCTITAAAGGTRSVTLASEAATALTGVRPGDAVDCTYVNRLKPTSLTLVKEVRNAFGGTAAPSAWTLTAAGPTAGVSGVTGAAAVTGRQVAAGAYTLSESGAPAGYTWSALTCVTSTGATIPGVSVAAPVVTLVPGQDVTCTYTNVDRPARLTLVKVVANGQTGGVAVPSDWTLTAAPVGIPGQSAVSGPGGSPAVTDRQVFSGGYDLSETGGPAGYRAGTWSCTGGTVSGARVTVPVGGDVTCTITNTAAAPRLSLVKTVTNDDGGTALPTAWTLSATGPVTISGATGSAAVTSAAVVAGRYSLAEAGGPGGYAAGAWSCTGGTVDGSVVTVRLGADVTCTIDNDDIPGRLTLVKTVDNGESGGTALPTDWTLTADGPSIVNGVSGEPSVTSVAVRAGSYDLSEAGGPEGYALGALSCVDAAGDAVDGPSAAHPTVDVALADDITCTFANTATAPTLTLVKIVDNGDTGATAVATDWTLTATGPSTLEGATGSDAVTDAAARVGTYDLSENGPGGYAASDWVCDGATASTATAVTLSLGDAATCTITNTAIQPRLTLVKVVVNSDAGTALPTDWTLAADGPSSISGVSGAVAVTRAAVVAGSYDLSETDGPDGYDLADLACVDDATGEQRTGTSAANPAVPLAPGDAVTCTFTNVAVTPEWTYRKSSNPVSGSTVLPGTVITYTLTVVRGEGVPARDVVLTDDLSDVLAHASLVDGSISPTLGTAAVSGATLTWTIPTLSASSTLTYQVRVDGDAQGATIGNVVTGTATTPPAPCPDDEPECRETHHLVPSWTVAKTSDPASGSMVTRGDAVTYTLTATNTGPATVSGAVVSDDLSGVLGSAVLVGELPDGVSVTGDVLTWSVPDLPVGTSASASYRVEVDDHAQGGDLVNVITATGPVSPADCAAPIVGRQGASRAAAAEAAGAPCATVHHVTALAATGGSITGWVVILSAALMLVGIAMVLLRRRRPTRE